LKFKDKKVIIFDLDGTLIDSAPDLAGAINYMLKSLDQNTFDIETIHKWVGNGAQVLVKRALSGNTIIDENIDENLFNKALDIFFKFYAQNLSVNTVTYPHVTETLQILKENGYRLVIVTNKPFDFITPILKELEIIDFFEYFIGGDSLSKKKPDPMPLLHVCDRLNVTVEESVMVGDSRNDILSANGCGMQSIGVTYGYNYNEAIAVYNPTVVIDDFKEILEIL
jgi:phosphoglycolate phosphatase